jgi:serine/threonine protein kinase/actin-like ATPase involved in cell morphogenesis
MILDGKYKLLRLLGEGGMGSVFEAINTWTERRVAVKIIKPELARYEQVVERFLREGKSASRVSHPNIVEILDMGRDADSGFLFMVQEYLTGVKLTELLRLKRRFPLLESLDILIPIMGALVAAHSKEVIHRDVKPDNIILCPGYGGEVRPKLIDFGLSKELARSTPELRKLTNPGILLGTPAYMSPEQIGADSDVDARTDVWSMGVLLYELLSGVHPFESGAVAETLRRVISEPIRPLDDRIPDIPADVAAVVARSLERTLGARLPSMRALLDALLACPSLEPETPERSLAIKHRRSIPYQRRHERFGVSWEVSLKCGDWGYAQRLATSNISTGGVFVVTRTPPPMDTLVELHLSLPDGEVLDLVGKVRHVIPADQAPPGKKPGIGIKFDAKHELDLVMLAQKAALHLEPGYQAFQAVTLGRPENLLPTKGHSPRGKQAGPGDAVEDATARPASPPDEPAAVAPKGSPPVRRPPPPLPQGRARGADRAAAPPPAGEGAAPDPSPAPASRKIVTPRGEVAEAIGIDFGTSYCSVSVAVGNKVYLVADEHQRILHPTLIAYPDGGAVAFGWEAREWLTRDPSRVIASVKRLLGRTRDDPLIAGFLQQLPLKVSEGPGGRLVFDLDGNLVAPVQVAAIAFENLARIAERQTGKRFQKAVLSTPVGFGADQHEALTRAAKMAGLETLELLSEPVAAALAYGFDSSTEEIIAVYDFGGGTFDFSVLSLGPKGYRVIVSAGDAWLGGDDLDLALAQAFADDFWKKTGVDLHHRIVEWQRLLLACEGAKRALSTLSEVEVDLPALVEHPQRIGLWDIVTRDRLEKLAEEAVRRSIDVCSQALASAGLAPSRVEKLIATGGVSRMPIVRRELGLLFERDVPVLVSPDEAVCLGTGIRAAMLARHKVAGPARIQID